MNSRSVRRRRMASMSASILIVLGVSLALTSVSPASTSRTTSPKKPAPKHHSRKRAKRRPAPKPLTQAQILKIIKDNEKPGPPGGTGPAGPAGANGAVAGYSATGSATPVPVGNGQTVVSKALPAGIYIVHAKAVLSGTGNSGDVAVGGCNLLSGATVIDSGQWDQPLGQLLQMPSVFAATATLPVEAGLSIRAPTTVSLQCFASGPSVPLSATFAQLQAVQVNTAA